MFGGTKGEVPLPNKFFLITYTKNLTYPYNDFFLRLQSKRAVPDKLAQPRLWLNACGMDTDKIRLDGVQCLCCLNSIFFRQLLAANPQQYELRQDHVRFFCHATAFNNGIRVKAFVDKFQYSIRAGFHSAVKMVQARLPERL